MNQIIKPKTFIVDFDGTCVRHEFPNIGKNIGAAPVLKALSDAGHRIILWTVRSHKEAPKYANKEVKAKDGQLLNEAIQWFGENDIKLYKINEVPEGQGRWSDSPKPHGTYIIDDLMLGDCVTFYESRRMVDWKIVMQYLYAEHLIEPLFLVPTGVVSLTYCAGITKEVRKEIEQFYLTDL